MRTRIVFSLFFSVIALGVLGAQNNPNIKNVPVSRTSAASGMEMYSQYCAVCHGTDGKGNGPAAPALKKAPTDLTQIAARNGGAYPDLKVLSILTSGDVVAHGSKDMPIWGSVLRSLDSNSASVVQLRLTNLTSYVKSLQAK
jgi:mono/diheme cytochrome c family protein